MERRTALRVPAASLVSRFIRDRRGASVLEFALVAPGLIALLIAILETSVLYFASASLQTATEAAARVILTGQAQNGSYTATQFKQAACNALPSFMACANLMVDVENASSFGSVNTTTPTITFDKNGNVSNSFSYTPGAAGDIVIIRLMYIWPVPSGPLGLNFATLGTGQRLLVATSVAKTEPY